MGPAVGLGEDAVYADLVARDDVLELLKEEVRQRTSSRKAWERIVRIALLPEPIDDTPGLLTQTLKPRRHVIVEHYAAKIQEAYDR